MQKKYEIVEDSVRLLNGRELYRIKALCDFGKVTRGDIGGWIENEQNLCHTGMCWIFDNACVCNNAQVSGDATVYGYGTVYDNAVIRDSAQVSNILIGGNTYVGHDVHLSTRCTIKNDARILTDADIMVFSNRFAGPTGLAFYNCADGSIKVSRTGFNGTIDDYITYVLKNYKLDRHIKMYTDPIAMAQRYFGIEVTL